MVWHRKMSGRVALLMVSLAACICAQEPARPPAANDPELPMTTLHVYMDLIQVPVLVLDSEHARVKPIDPSRFLVRLDAGPVFHPRHVRQEGDDPISLSILLDPDSVSELMPDFSAAVVRMAGTSLHPQDRVTVYVMNCGLFRTLQDVAPEANALKGGLDRAIEHWQLARKRKPAVPCARPVGLWDAMTSVLKDMARRPGRPILLAVTQGEEKGSKNTWDELRVLAQGNGVAVFGYSSRQGLSTMYGGSGLRSGGISQGYQVGVSRPEPQNAFGSICELSGGMVMGADARFEARQLARFLATVRERYILEFSRPRNDLPGEHNIEVTIARGSPQSYIRPSGVTIVTGHASAVADPTIIPQDRTDAPEMGTRKVLTGH